MSAYHVCDESFRRFCHIYIGLYCKAQSQLIKNFKQSRKVWSRFTGFYSCNRGMWNATKVGKITLRQLKIVPLLYHSTYDG